MNKKTLSIIIPCFNEQDNILHILEKIDQVELPFDIQKEIIIIDDYSTDRTREILSTLDTTKYTIHFQDKNYGKWYAVRTWIHRATGDYIIIQDADLEYDPQDYTPLLTKLIEEDLPVIYGSRRMNNNNKAYSGRIYYVGGNITTILINILYGVHLTDGNTCYKMFTRQSIQGMHFVSQRFDFDQEISSQFLKKYKFITEIPIRYYPRSSTEGKKINIYDFFHALDVILKFRFGFDKQKRTSLKIIWLGLLCCGIFSLSLALLYLSNFYQAHAYRSIAIAFTIADMIGYRGIKLFFFWAQRIAITTLIKSYIIHIASLLIIYFAGVFYFVKIANWQWFYQWVFFMVMSILMVGGGNFLHNLMKGIWDME